MPLLSCIADAVLPRVCGTPLLRGQFKVRTDDFCVTEELGFECSGEGEHLWLFVRKSGISTTDAAACLARAAGVRMSALSWSGLKDKHGICRQWFSVHSPGKALGAFQSLKSDALVIEKMQRNHRKLRRGSHRSNHFRIRLRSLKPNSEDVTSMTALDDLEKRIEWIISNGVPNYFGEQRFGYSNLENAAEFFLGNRIPRGRNERGMWLSAARSAIFNAVLAQRVLDGTWNQYLPGDVMNLDGSASVFVSDSCDRTLCERLRLMDIHPTGPMWGQGALRSSAQVLALESEIAQNLDVFSEGLAGMGLQQERRSLRLPVKALNYSRLALQSCEGADQAPGVELSFSLPSGSYATAVLHELLCYDTRQEAIT
jgi:tRNA pseudouridine13 synthase